MRRPSIVNYGQPPHPWAAFPRLAPPASQIVEKSLFDNSFAAAAAACLFTKEHPAGWEYASNISSNVFSGTSAAADQTTFYDPGHCSLSETIGLTSGAVSQSSLQVASGLPVSDLTSKLMVEPPAEYLNSVARVTPDYFDSGQENFAVHGQHSMINISGFLSNQTDANEGYYQSRYNGNGVSIPSIQLPPGFTTQCVSSNPTAYLLKHNSSDSGILLSPDGKIEPLFLGQKRADFEQLTCPPSISYLQPDYAPEAGVFHRADTRKGVSFSQPFMSSDPQPINPLQGTTCGMPQLNEELFPTFDMRYLPDILNLPSNPGDVLAYFNSICGAVALSESRKAWIEENMVVTESLFNLIDEYIFEMCDALNPKRLLRPNGHPVFSHTIEDTTGAGGPTSMTIFRWKQNLKDSRMHLKRLNRLAYGHAMNKSKVEAVWKAMINYRDRWANQIFSGCESEYWEASPLQVECMKEYYRFNGEMQRLIRTIEDDMLDIGRLENMITVFRASVFKAECKLKKIKKAFGTKHES
ncbi:hypothetical protein ABW20_dc0103960 [Dactylellina cionopaga]|nr:hypothetical protein ABW20_dc0103960 [Dactylellina cionopaga]